MDDYYGTRGCCRTCREPETMHGYREDVDYEDKHYSCICYECKCRKCIWYDPDLRKCTFSNV